ncbi:MAG: PBP1A family penicillin-binding protein [Clostridiales bacterium]|jgi:penicillin-binding protein 1A|nr:PBP1A family penicillin-binding protein [Clostridiales bacterium]
MQNQNQGGKPKPSGQKNSQNKNVKKKRVVQETVSDQSTKPHGQGVSAVPSSGGYTRAQAYEREKTERDPQQRSTRPIAPENSALADELRSRLRGKPTRAAHERHWYMEVFHGLMDILKTAVVILVCVGFLAGGFGGGMLIGYISTTTPLSVTDITMTESVETSFVYDANGTVLAKLTGSENVDRVYVAYTEVKDTYIDEAIMAIEDERFLEHSGIDVQRIGSAVLSALVNGGTASHGGSTITQQTVKLISGQDQRSTQRKVQEWFSAMTLEQQISKDEIMQLYINLAPMGNNYVGVEAAAQNYFGKNAKELSLAECAFLAGLPKSPSYYNPLRESGRRNAMRRMRIVLSKMYELGFISLEEYNSALNTELVFKSVNTTSATKINSYFVEYAVSEVISDIQKKRNISRSLAATTVYNRGYHIYTTMEADVQAVMDEAFMTKELFQSDPEALEDYPEKPQGGMVVINVKTGAIAGMQGGYGEKTVNLGTNRAVDAHRQPGSSIKPLIAYCPALELRLITPSMTYVDEEMHLDRNNPSVVWPKNSDNAYKGAMSIRQAVASSRNTIAVKVWYDVGAEMALWFLNEVGINRLTEKYPSTAVGGFNVGMSPLEMAAAYNTFASGGVYTEPYAYTKVLDSNNNVVLEHESKSHRVYREDTTFLMTSMLQDVIKSGTAAGKVHPIENENGESIAVAGKTGTTDDNVDKWFCGFTPYYAAAVWYGYDNRLRTTEIPKGDRNNAQYIWDYVMQRIHKNLPEAKFEVPDNIVRATVCSSSGLKATQFCQEAGTAIEDYFIADSYLNPQNECQFHKATPTPTPAPPPNQGLVPVLGG